MKNRQKNVKYKDKEWLRQQFEVEKRDLRSIAEECGVTKGTIKKWAEKLDINRGTVFQRWISAMGFATTCPKCGSTVPNANYCSECGVALK